jgi:hypothetical protein
VYILYERSHAKDFSFLRKGPQTKPVKHVVKINKLNFPLDKVTQLENQEEEYDLHELTCDYRISSIHQEERDTDADLWIYGIREIVLQTMKDPWKGTRDYRDGHCVSKAKTTNTSKYYSENRTVFLHLSYTGGRK